MKKGFTMIELIFVIVILGILASVAIPRLAGTREDAEISTAIGNLRTILSEASGYHVAHGTFGTVKWKDLTNVPLKAGATNGADIGADIGDAAATTVAYLVVGGVNCIGVNLVEKSTTAPAHIKFTKKNPATGVCQTVIGKDPVRTFISGTIKPTTGNDITDAMPIGSTTSVY